MIQATDLRIGNYFLFESEVMKITSFDHLRAVFVEEAGGWFTFDKIEPIPITPEILEKCGFVKALIFGSFGEYYYDGKHISLTLDFELSTSSREYGSQSVDGSIKMKYLHQLQNLHFALTGIELEVNL